MSITALLQRLNDEQRSATVKLCRLFPQSEKAKELAQEFTRTVRERSADKFNDRQRSAMRGKSKEFVGYARGLSEVIKSAGEPEKLKTRGRI